MYKDEQGEFELERVGEYYAKKYVKKETKRIDWSKVFHGCIVKRHGLSENIPGEVYDKEFQDCWYIAKAGNYRFDTTHWHGWLGGECPLPDGVIVEIVRRDRSRSKLEAAHRDMKWSHNLGYTDIIAFRIVGLADGWDY